MVVLLGSVVPAVAADVKPAERTRVVAEVLELAAVRSSVEQLPRALGKELAQQPPVSEPAARDVIVPALRQAFNADQLYAFVQSTFESEYDGARLSAIAKQLRTPLGRRMAALEVEAQSPSSNDAMREFMAKLPNNRPPPERLALIRRLDSASHATEVNLEMTVAAQIAAARVVDVALPPAQRRNPPDVPAALRALPLITWSQARTATEDGLLFAYRTVNDKDLRTYVATAESDAGRWFSGVLQRAFLNAFTMATAQAVERVQSELAAKRTP
jgi:hypothetical protein